MAIYSKYRITDLDELVGHVAWKQHVRNGRATKVPYSPHSDRPCDVTDLRSHSTYQEAKKASRRILSATESGGTGMVLGKHRALADYCLVGVDLDECRDPDTGAIEDWAERILDFLDTYTEVSPSGRGVKSFMLCTDEVWQSVLKLLGKDSNGNQIFGRAFKRKSI